MEAEPPAGRQGVTVGERLNANVTVRTDADGRVFSA
jgi:hypothetical protein